eukprot:15064557-Alexandrium_andersonii.AAC.1
MEPLEVHVDDGAAAGPDAGLLPPVSAELWHHVHVAPLLAVLADTVLSVQARPGDGLHVVQPRAMQPDRAPVRVLRREHVERLPHIDEGAEAARVGLAGTE